MTRDVTINCRDIDHAQTIVHALDAIDGIKLIHHSDRTFLMHLGGKIEVVSKAPIKTRDDLSMAYTPGVARVCMAIYDEPQDVYNLTIKKNTVAVVTDGTAVLGLGDIGPAGAMPVMEGKCALFKEFANVDAFPLAIDSKDPRVIVDTVKRVATAFGGINLEDISAPRCFEIEEWLQNEIDVPVFHDDQHGTSVVTLAALINALYVVDKDMKDLKVVFNGVGASGVATSKIFMEEGVANIIGLRPRRSHLPGPYREHELHEGLVRVEHQSEPGDGHAAGGHRGRRRLRGTFRPRHFHGRDAAQNEPRPGGLRDGQPGTGDHARGGGSARAHHGHRAVGLPQPDQQRAGVSGHLPRAPWIVRHGSSMTR